MQEITVMPLEKINQIEKAVNKLKKLINKVCPDNLSRYYAQIKLDSVFMCADDSITYGKD